MKRKIVLLPFVIFVLAVTILSCCSKEQSTCKRYVLLSYKYTKEYRLLQIDTLYPKPSKNWTPDILCESELSKIKNAKVLDTISWINCSPPWYWKPEFVIEVLYNKLY